MKWPYTLYINSSVWTAAGSKSCAHSLCPLWPVYIYPCIQVCPVRMSLQTLSQSFIIQIFIWITSSWTQLSPSFKLILKEAWHEQLLLAYDRLHWAPKTKIKTFYYSNFCFVTTDKCSWENVAWFHLVNWQWNAPEALKNENLQWGIKLFFRFEVPFIIAVIAVILIAEFNV